jgi:tetratricopeptide (TPR) repeat protein
MRRLMLITLFGFGLAPAAIAQELPGLPPPGVMPPGVAPPDAAPRGRAGESKAEKPPPRRPVSIDELFSRLAEAKDETEAAGVARLIERRWSRSGSDTSDLLMSRAGEALKAKDYALSIELIDRVLALTPDWAEAWNRRATAFYLLDDPVSAMADIRQALSHEPRHYSAWAGLGHIYLAGGDKRSALMAYRKALELNPFFENLKQAVERLAPEVDGRDI